MHSKRVAKDRLVKWVNQATNGQESYTVMHFACFNGNLHILKYAIEMGATINQANRQSRSGISLFHAAAQGDHAHILGFLKRITEKDYIKLDLTKYRDLNNSSPIHWACAKGSENILQYLLAWGPTDINSQDSLGLTPLHLAVKSAEDIKSTRMVRLLLIRGAERNIKDIYGRKAINIA